MKFKLDEKALEKAGIDVMKAIEKHTTHTATTLAILSAVQISVITGFAIEQMEQSRKVRK